MKFTHFILSCMVAFVATTAGATEVGLERTARFARFAIEHITANSGFVLLPHSIGLRPVEDAGFFDALKDAVFAQGDEYRVHFLLRDQEGRSYLGSLTIAVPFPGVDRGGVPRIIQVLGISGSRKLYYQVSEFTDSLEVPKFSGNLTVLDLSLRLVGQAL